MFAVDRRAVLYTVHHVPVGVWLTGNLGKSGEPDGFGAADRQSVRVCVPSLMRQMVGSGGITAPDGALLEVSLQNVTAREGVFAEMTHIRAVSSVCKRLARGRNESRMGEGEEEADARLKRCLFKCLACR